MKEMKRILSLFLCLVMLVGYLPVGALAAEGESATEPSVVETTEATEAAVETTEAATEETTEPVVETTVPETTEETVPETKPVPPPMFTFMGGASKEAAGDTQVTAEECVDAAIFFSDLHTTKGNYRTSQINNVFGQMKGTGLPFSSVTSVGDAFSSNENAYADSTDNVTTPIRNALGDTEIPVLYTWSDHDRAAGIDNFTGLLYGDDSTGYYIYAISMSDMTSSTRYGVASTFKEEKLTAFTNTVASLDPSKPLFVATHVPLHDRRDDNQYADEWYGVISAAAEKMDVAVFWGHNHTSEQSADFNAYYVAKNGNEKITIDGKGSVVPNFTYMNVGYMNDSQYNSNSTCEFVATAVAIKEKEVVYTLYGESGIHECSNHKNVTVPRDHWNDKASGGNTDPVPEETTPYVDGITVVNNKETYKVGEALDITVYELYSNGEKGNVVTGYNVSGYDSSKLGAQTVVVTYGKYSTTVSVTVKEVSAEPKVTELKVTYTKETLLGETLNLKVTAVYDDGTEKALTAGEYTVEGYNPAATGAQGVTVTYETASYGFNVIKHAESNVTVLADGMTSLNVTDAAETVAAAVADKLADGYVAYDITPEGYTTEKNPAVVTMPAPAGANAVYHVNGEILEPITDAVFGDGKVAFTASAFSTYIVGESANIVVDDPKDVTGSGNVTTTEEKKVYVLVSTPAAEKQYIIVSRNTAGSGYALKENTTTGSIITVKAAGNGISAPYIETTDEAIMWNAASGMTFKSENGGYYLRYNNGLAFNTSNSTNWTVGSNSAYVYSSSRYRYVYNNNGTWTTSSSRSTSNSYPAYFYEKQTVEVETTTTVPGTYSIAGKDVSVVTVEGSTVALSSTLTFTPDSGAAVTNTENPSGVTYTVVQNGDPNGVISDIRGNTVIFTGETGKALVKVSYTTSFGEVTNYITVEAVEPYYTLDLHEQTTGADGKPVVGEEITQTIAIKGVEKDDTYSVWAVIKFYDGVLDDAGNDAEDLGALENPTDIVWTSSNTSVATVNAETGVITFTGKDGVVKITATYEGEDKGAYNYPSDTITISATQSNYVVPEDGPADFPEYPNEGAIRFDKTATAVGNFSETGIAQIELSMTGVPYTTGSEMDVVLMLDHSNSMTEERMRATREAVKVFVNNIVKNEDGSFNGNRIYIASFAGGNPDPQYAGQSRHEFRIYKMTRNEENGYQIVNSQDELNELIAEVNKTYVKFTSNAPYGTEYAQSLEDCYNVLNASKADGNQQFCVFMSDGIPNVYQYGAGANDKTTSSSSMAEMFATTGSTRYATRGSNYKYEYWSSLMKSNGVTVFTVGLGLNGTNSALSGASAAECERVSNMLLNDISGPAGETAADRDTGNAVSKLNEYFFSVADANAADDMKDVFHNISKKIMQAATDITVEDKITPQYTMIFDIPTGDKVIEGVQNDFYIEFVKYTLDAKTHERVDTDNDGNTIEHATSVSKLYLKTGTDGLYAAKDATGTAYDAPVFEQKVIGDKGTLYYWSDKEDDSKESGISVVGKDGKTYYFVPYGMKTAGYNLTSGGYAKGTVGDGNMSTNLIIATPYFVYNADTKMLYWTLDKMQDATTEYALRYFVYLNNSATEVGTSKETDPGSYLTNEYAFLTYTNHNGTECRQEFPKPQLTWSGAQVSYVFYLVNAAGEPINKSGQVVDFANAVYVTKPYTENTVWNKGADGQITADSKLSVEWLAKELLPDDYSVYDVNAKYQLHVFGDHTGASIFDYFVIGGGSKAEIADHLSESLRKQITAGTVSQTTTKVYNTKAGTKIEKYGTYTSKDTDEYSDEIVLTGFDFYNTTVAFAVVWEPTLVPDSFVVDYGLDLLINPLENDLMQDSVLSGIGLSTAAYDKENIAINTGLATTSKLGQNPVTVNGHTLSFENDRQLRFSQGSMVFNEPAVFYYETEAKYYEGSNQRTGFMYSSITVIPATTVYYEDEYVDLKTYTKNGDGWDKTADAWAVNSTEANATQAQDRPGTTNIINVLDANNNYGYDQAYSSMSTYSMGTAAMITVDANTYGTAEFTFYGTGFDVVSLTSNATGTITVLVKDKDGNTVRNTLVDTYYGYTKNADGNWVVDAKAANSLYQIPVIKIFDLPYGQYSVKITAAWNDFFDHIDKSTDYDFYLDAIRIYDPTGNKNATANNAYKQDGEAYPVYQELRNNVISASDFESTEEGIINGIVFIDGDAATTNLTDYISYGPNNELYLAPGQMVIFELDLDAYLKEGVAVDKVQLGIKSADGNAVTYAAMEATTGLTKADMEAAATNTVSTSTDMYYDITELKDNAICIYNKSGGILSLTNIKITFTDAPADTTGDLFYVNPELIRQILNNLQTVDSEETKELKISVELPELVKQAVLDEDGFVTNDADFEIKIRSEDIPIELNEEGDPVSEVTVTVVWKISEENEVAFDVVLTEDDQGYLWLVEEAYLMVTGDANASTETIIITASYGDAEPAVVETEVKVYKYNPTIESVTPDTVEKDKLTTFKVTTDNSVEAMNIGGEVVTSYRKVGNKRIWTAKLAYPDDTEPVTIKAYSKEGYEYEYKHEITVTNPTQGTAKSVRDTVITIAQNLLKLLGFMK